VTWTLPEPMLTACTSLRCAGGGSTKCARRPRRSSAQSPVPWPFPARCCPAGTTLKAAFNTSVASPPSPRRQVGRSLVCSLRGGAGIRWTDWSFSAGWGSQEKLNVRLVDPAWVVEVGVDVARDASGRWRHPARLHRARPDLSPADVPRGRGRVRRTHTSPGRVTSPPRRRRPGNSRPLRKSGDGGRGQEGMICHCCRVSDAYGCCSIWAPSAVCPRRRRGRARCSG
jgi:hypothetical protein